MEYRPLLCLFFPNLDGQLMYIHIRSSQEWFLNDIGNDILNFGAIVFYKPHYDDRQPDIFDEWLDLTFKPVEAA